MTKRKVLYVSYDGMTDPLGQSQVIPYLQELSKQGYSFHILSAEKTENYQNHKTEISALLKSSGIQWHPVIYTKKPPVISTIKDIRKIIKEAVRLHKQFNFSISHCRSYIAAFAGMKLKKDFNVPFLFDMRGFYADERIDGGLWNQSNPVYRIVYNYFKRKEKSFMNGCDHLVSLTESGKDVICEWNFEELSAGDISVIPCCADLNHFNPGHLNTDKVEKFRRELNIPRDSFILTYLGSVGTWYLPGEMLDFFTELLRERDNSRFLIITRDDTSQMKQMAKDKGIPEERLIFRAASRNEVPALLSLSDLSVFFIKPVFSKKASSPTKLAEILGMGVPVICNGNVGDIDRIIEKHKVGAVIREFTQEAYRDSMKEIPRLLKTDPDYLRQVSDNLFSLREGSKRYLKVYKRIEK